MLAQRLSALRVAAIEATRPPGVAAVRRTVARRAARRTVAGAFVLLLLAVAVVLAGATGRDPSPVLPPTLTPTPAPSVTPSTVESTTTTTSPAATSSPVSTTSTSGLRCGYQKLGGADILGSDPLSVGPPDYWSRCPSSRLRILAVTYEWDIGGQQYTQAHVTTIYLTRANQTAPMPAPQLDPIANECAYLFVVIGTMSISRRR
jgi:hypothetical protein